MRAGQIMVQDESCLAAVAKNTRSGSAASCQSARYVRARLALAQEPRLMVYRRGAC